MMVLISKQAQFAFQFIHSYFTFNNKLISFDGNENFLSQHKKNA